MVLKAAIADAVGKTGQGASTIPEPLPPLRSKPDPRTKADRVLGIQSESERISPPTHPDDAVASNQCTRCTFSNHPTLHVCELCGAPLGTPNRPKNMQQYMDATSSSTLGTLYHPAADTNDLIKLSFREGGEKIFHERLKHCMTQRKWLLQGAPPVPKPSQAGQDSSGSTTPTGERMKTVGIAGLEERRLNIRKNNEIVIGSAFEDLEALMASAKEIVALAETFAASDGSGSSESNAVANALGLVTTKDMLGGGSTSESLYISELSRNLAEYLTDDATGVLRKSGGILTLVDLWAKFNRARGGVELVSPTDFEKAARLWEKLKLPVRLREFKSGVLVVQGSDRTDEKTIKSLLSWLGDFHFFPPDAEVLWDWQEFGRGITVQDAADRFGWSIGVAEEELLMAVEREALCREENPAGCRYWENRFLE